MHFATLLAYFSAVSTILLPPITSLIKLQFLKQNRVFHLFFYYFIFAAAIELLTWLMSLKQINNILIGNVFFLLQCIILSLLLLNWIEDRNNKIILKIILLLTVICALVRTVLFNPAEELDNISISLEGIVLILISGFALFTVSAETEIPLLKNPKLWFCAAVFIYFSLNMAVFCTGNFLMEDRSPLRKYTWMINSVLTIISNIFYSIGILWSRPKRI